MDTMRTGWAIFCVMRGRCEATLMPNTSGNNRMTTILRSKETKSISNDFISVASEGRIDPQRKKLSGVMKNAPSDVKAVSVTDSATCPRAICEKKFDTLPPGQHATSNMPKAMPGEIGNTEIKSKVSSGNKTICANKPVAIAFFWPTSWVKCAHLISKATPNMMMARQMFKTVRLLSENWMVASGKWSRFCF